MLKRKSIILCVLLVATLSCSQSAQIAGAGQEYEFIRPGTPAFECKILEKNLSILVKRDPETLCAVDVIPHNSADCSQGKGDPITGNPWKSDPKNLPKIAFTGAGNQFCQEAFMVFENSPNCYVYTSGGNTYYITPKTCCPKFPKACPD